MKLIIGPQGNKILTICVFFIKYFKKINTPNQFSTKFI